MFTGTYTALVTPFKNGKVDFKSFENLIKLQLSSKVDGIVPCGTTGESPTLSHEEHNQVIEFAIKIAKGKAKVIAGTGSNSTSEAIKLSKHAEESGADGVLLVSPYYNKPTQEGLFLHYKKIANSIKIPCVLYNVPGRTSKEISSETIFRLSKIKNITTLKDATGNIDTGSEAINIVDKNFSVISGNDSITLPLIAVGGKGVISVLSNILPKEVKKMVDLALSGKISQAAKYHHKLWRLFNDIFVETNPIPIKTALYMAGIIETNDFRLPLCKMNNENKKILVKAFNDFGYKF